ncbi:hypothetical protein [Pengzhenrongella phosphoraccumulans]|jgi:hypothetical protein|uniref:hypothetical protein n=1 Tax=Pengzhenrongella phosphoraccumulans TaxID=3114394 RepID=UPI0038911055
MPRAPELLSRPPELAGARPRVRRARWQVVALAVAAFGCLALLAADLGGLTGAGPVGTTSGDVTDAGTSGSTSQDGTKHSAKKKAKPKPAVRYPDEKSTGVPAGVVLQPSGPLVITQPGAIIDGLEITGTVVVAADDVTIRRSRILGETGSIILKNEGRNLQVVDTEIDGRGKGGPAVAFRDYSLLRVNIHDVAEGPRIAGGNVTISDSYVHHLVQVGDNHTDVIQAVSGSRIVIKGNSLQAFNPDTGSLGNAAFMFGEDDNPLRDCLVEGNLMNGGNYTVNGGGRGTTGAACTFKSNVFGKDFRFGTHANLGPNVVWDSSNASR